jgi:hypothetical protein
VGQTVRGMHHPVIDLVKRGIQNEFWKNVDLFVLARNVVALATFSGIWLVGSSVDVHCF